MKHYKGNDMAWAFMVTCKMGLLFFANFVIHDDSEINAEVYWNIMFANLQTNASNLIRTTANPTKHFMGDSYWNNNPV